MAEEPKNDVGESVTSKDTEIKKKKKKGILSRLWGALFKRRGDDFEKRLEHITKEEAVVLARITRRSHSWRRIARQLIIFSLLFEAIAVGYAIMSTRSIGLNWQIRALRVLPMFLLPALCVITYLGLRSFTRMRDQKDHRTLEKLRTERQAKIDELKERTNYYITQQLIQRYDPDPAAKAAAATVLASKLGADSGLKVYVGDDPNSNPPPGKSSDIELARTTGLRHRKQPLSKTTSVDSGLIQGPEGILSSSGLDGVNFSQQQQMVVEHHPQAGMNTSSGGWIARLAALLVGEDPTQSYALICGNCHMHNGLARKEDFPYIAYYCPHCKAFNGHNQPDGGISGPYLSTISSLVSAEDTAAPVPDGPVGEDKVTSRGGSTSDKVSVASNPVANDVSGISDS